MSGSKCDLKRTQGSIFFHSSLCKKFFFFFILFKRLSDYILSVMNGAVAVVVVVVAVAVVQVVPDGKGLAGVFRTDQKSLSFSPLPPQLADIQSFSYSSFRQVRNFLTRLNATFEVHK